jgi:tetratricopeptide (TPR) repeat protein
MTLAFDEPVLRVTKDPEGVFRGGNRMRLLKLGGSLAAAKLADDAVEGAAGATKARYLGLAAGAADGASKRRRSKAAQGRHNRGRAQTHAHRADPWYARTRRAPAGVLSLAIPMATLQLSRQVCAMSQSPNSAAPQQVAHLLALASKLLRAGRPADAIAPLRDAALLEPFNSIIQHDLGLAFLEVGRLPDAVAALQWAVASNPRYTDAYFRLGIALEKLGNIGGAIAAYDHATKLLPSLTEAWFRAGALVYTLGHCEEAIGCFRRAAATGGKTSFGRLGKARALLIEDRNQEAEQVLRQMLARDPGNAMAHDLLGNLLSEFGRFDEARECFQRAIAIAPLLAGSYYDLVRCRRVASDDDGLLQRMDALATPGLEAAQRLRLHLAIGKAADDLGAYALAMQHFDAADAVRRSSASFDSAAFSIETERLIARCTRELIARAPELGSCDATPVLIIGMPRSGTTLVEQIISMHPEVGAGGELSFWNQRGSEWLRSGATGNERPVVVSEFLAKAAADYLRVLRAISPNASRVTDKMPFNFLWAGLIHLAFPRAIIVHCRRAAIDTALSIHQTHFHPTLPFPTGGAELVEYFHSYQRLIDHWRSVLPVDRFIEVDYEALTRTPEPVVHRIIVACGLAWNDACLRPESNPRTVKTPSKWQTRQPIYRTSVERWRRYEPWLGALRALVDDASKLDVSVARS